MEGENERIGSISRPWGAVWLDLALSRVISRASSTAGHRTT